MARRHELLRGEIAVGKLGAEEHSQKRSQSERIQNPARMDLVEFQIVEISENHWKPRAPNEKLQHHHEEKFEADCFVHRIGLLESVGERARSGKQRARLRVVGFLWSVVFERERPAPSQRPTTDHLQLTTDYPLGRLPNVLPPFSLPPCVSRSRN